ncbi:MAG: hypothetical protein QNL93_03325 [Opitutae bacterium]
MVKVSYIVNSITLLLLFTSGWKISSTIAELEFSQERLTEFTSKVTGITLALEEAKKGQVDRLAREKRKNVELEDQNNAYVDEVLDLTRKRDELKQVIESNIKENEELSATIQKNKVSLAGADTQIEASRQEIRRISLIIPNLQAEITNLENQILNERKRQKDLDLEIATYDMETSILKDHYKLTISALRKDFYERPWLDRGERVSVAYSKVDLKSGLLMLPIGKNYGFEQNMRFAVRANGQSICQVEIKEVAFDHCVAMIIPLMGNPNKLKEFTKLDLIYL